MIIVSKKGIVNDVDYWVITPYSVRHLLEHSSSTINEDECCRFNNSSCDAVGSTNGLVCLMNDNLKQDGIREIWFRFWSSKSHQL
jgi:hypothetical protein